MAKGRFISFLLMMFLLSLFRLSTVILAFLLPQESMKMELIHRHASQLNPRPLTQLERIKDLLHSDILRQKMISHKRQQSLSPRREAWEKHYKSNNKSTNAIQMPLQAGNDYGTGQYLIEFKVGTPSQKFRLIVDSGSELTWMNCRYRCDYNCRRKGRIAKRRFFKADLSSSFKTIPCFSDTCKIELSNLFSLNRCPTPTTPCAYDYSYTDGSRSMGIFAKERVAVGLTNGRKAKIQDVLIGCSDSFEGPSFAKADGIMGLAYSKYSFVRKATENFGGKFSYCLVDHLSPKNVSNYLTFGGKNTETSTTGKMRYTKLALISPFYAVNVKGISIGGVMLKIPAEVWDGNRGGGTTVDSGTSLFILSKPAYEPVMAEFKNHVSRYQRMKIDGVPMEYCFNSTGFVVSSIPKLIIHFTDGARFEPHVKSYVIDIANEVKCLGVLSVKWPGISNIGNIMQQNYFWEIDLVGSQLGFAPSSCS